MASEHNKSQANFRQSGRLDLGKVNCWLERCEKDAFAQAYYTLADGKERTEFLGEDLDRFLP